MGNAQKTLESCVGNSPARLMNEDTFLLLLRHLSIVDYLTLACASKGFMQILEKNNYFWAQLCHRVCTAPFCDGSMTLPDSPSKLLAKVWPDNDAVNKLEDANIKDKKVVANFDFKDTLKRYFIYFVQYALLHIHFGNVFWAAEKSPTITACICDGTWATNIWSRRKLKKHGCATDFYYSIDLGYDVKKLEKFQSMVSEEKVKVPDEFGGRLIVYVKSKEKPDLTSYREGSLVKPGTICTSGRGSVINPLYAD